MRAHWVEELRELGQINHGTFLWSDFEDRLERWARVEWICVSKYIPHCLPILLEDRCDVGLGVYPMLLVGCLQLMVWLKGDSIVLQMLLKYPQPKWNRSIFYFTGDREYSLILFESQVPSQLQIHDGVNPSQEEAAESRKVCWAIGNKSCLRETLETAKKEVRPFRGAPLCGPWRRGSDRKPGVPYKVG